MKDDPERAGRGCGRTLGSGYDLPRWAFVVRCRSGLAWMTVPGDSRSAAAAVADFFFVSTPGDRQEGGHHLLIRIAPYGSSRPAAVPARDR